MKKTITLIEIAFARLMNFFGFSKSTEPIPKGVYCYGCIDDEQTKIATRESWQITPIENPKFIDIDLHFSDEHFLKLKKGFIPKAMEDKWFIFYEDEWIYFHRGWTGNGIYKAKLNKLQNSYSIEGFWVERDQEKYKNKDDHEDVKIFLFLIAKGLLRVDVRDICSNTNLSFETNVLSAWKNFGNMFIENHTSTAPKTRPCKYFRRVNDHITACTFTGFYGFDSGHNDQCKICGENMGWDEEN